MTAMYVCNTCDRKFDHRAAFNRHQRRKTVCRKPTCSCTACERKFVSEESLAKHKKYYCKDRGLAREEPPAAANTSSLSNILSALYARDNPQQTSAGDFATTFHELLESLKPVLSPAPAPQAPPAPAPAPPPPLETTVEEEEVIETGNQQQQ